MAKGAPQPGVWSGYVVNDLKRPDLPLSKKGLFASLSLFPLPTCVDTMGYFSMDPTSLMLAI